MGNSIYDVKKIFLERKSVREFSQIAISQDVLDALIEIGLSGPISGGLDCLFIKELNDQSEKQICYKACYYQEFIKNAPTVLVIGCYDDIISTKYNQEFANIFSCQNATIAAQNIIIASEQLGIKSCFVGALRKNVMADILSEENRKVNPWVVVCLGL